jgi:hypothetical protein
MFATLLLGKNNKVIGAAAEAAEGEGPSVGFTPRKGQRVVPNVDVSLVFAEGDFEQGVRQLMKSKFDLKRKKLLVAKRGK